jgi:class 3 adenylate cyclase
MHRRFKELLESADGVSEFIIAVNLDIRGFSSFSKGVESPDVAMFIKRVYKRLLDKYFPDASFFKPTGDGLLLTIPYNERTLQEVTRNTFDSCFKVLRDYGSFCKNDPMINFDIPKKIGIGLSRGTACRLVAKGKTLDYSGRVLNLASRLMDFARPTGIVFDAEFDIKLLSDRQKKLFWRDSIYIKGVAEREPIAIYYTNDLTVISPINKRPLAKIKWAKVVDIKSLKQIKEVGPKFLYDLKTEPANSREIELKVTHPVISKGRKLRGILNHFYFNGFEYFLELGKPVLRVDFDELAERLEESEVKDNWDIELNIIYPER